MYVEIDGVDLSNCVQESTYNVDSEDEYTEWKDAASVKHHRLKRTRIKGSFDMVFIPGYTRDYSFFLEKLANAKTDNYVQMTIDVNNTNTRKTSNFFYRIKFQPPRKIANGLIFKRCTISIEER